MDMVGIVILVAMAIVAIRLFAGSSDRPRIAEYVRSLGGEVVSVEWQPFGKGWFGEKNDRIYRVTYIDRHGLTHAAWCKTSMFSGVYLSDDEVIQQPPSPPAPPLEQRVRDLEAENAELRRRLQQP